MRTETYYFSPCVQRRTTTVYAPARAVRAQVHAEAEGRSQGDLGGTGCYQGDLGGATGCYQGDLGGVEGEEPR